MSFNKRLVQGGFVFNHTRLVLSLPGKKEQEKGPGKAAKYQWRIDNKTKNKQGKSVIKTSYRNLISDYIFRLAEENDKKMAQIVLERFANVGAYYVTLED